MRKTLRILAAASALALTQGAARADTVNLTGLTYGPGLGVTVNFALGGNGMAPLPGPGTKNFLAGGFSGSYSGSSYSFFGPTSAETYCVEIYENIAVGATAGYSVVDPAGAGQYTTGGANGWGANHAATSARIDQLMAYAYPLVNSSDTSTALQLAIWNVIYDTDLLVGAGVFSATNALPADAAAFATVAGIANGYLSGSLATVATRHYLVATHDGTQDLLVIPAPGTLALAGLGLAGVVASQRRRAVPG